MAVCPKFVCDLTEIYEVIPVPPCDDPEIDCHDQKYVCEKYCKYYDCKYCHLALSGECPVHE